MNDSNKQFFAVIIFILFLVISITGLAISSSKDDKIKTNNSNSNIEDIIDGEIVVPEVEDSEPVKVITSNIKPTNSNVKSNHQTSNKSNSTGGGSTGNNTVKSNSNYVGVSYFITELNKNKIYVGGTANVSVIIKPDNATNKKVIYNSTDSSIARVTDTGTIVGISPGTCYIDITVVDGGSSRVLITVLKRPTPVNSNSTSSKTSNSTSSTTSNNVSNSNVTSNTTSNRVSNSNVTSNTTSNRVSNSNTTVNVTSIKLNKTSLSLKLNAKETLTATISPSNATNKNVTWSSSNNSIATVSNGVVTAVGVGKATITVRSSNGLTSTCTVTIDGWTADKKNYYKNGQKVTNTYVDYIYIDANGNAQAKMGPFSITTYGARAWAERQLNLRASASTSSALVTTIPEGSKMTIIGEESNGYIKVKYGSYTGYAYTAYIFINLPDVIPNVKYDITNGYKSVFKSSGIDLPGITGKNLYGYSLHTDQKTGLQNYYAPLLYPVAKRFQNAYNLASKDGYTFIVYDTYRPSNVARDVSTSLTNLANSNVTVRNGINAEGMNISWFIAPNGMTNHARGIAMDIALAKKSGNNYVLQPAQTDIHELSVAALRKKNVPNADKLSSYMTRAGFSTLSSEWWHFEDTAYNSYPCSSFRIS